MSGWWEMVNAIYEANREQEEERESQESEVRGDELSFDNWLRSEHDRIMAEIHEEDAILGTSSRDAREALRETERDAMADVYNIDGLSDLDFGKEDSWNGLSDEQAHDILGGLDTHQLAAFTESVEMFEMELALENMGYGVAGSSLRRDYIDADGGPDDQEGEEGDEGEDGWGAS